MPSAIPADLPHLEAALQRPLPSLRDRVLHLLALKARLIQLGHPASPEAIANRLGQSVAVVRALGDVGAMDLPARLLSRRDTDAARLLAVQRRSRRTAVPYVELPSIFGGTELVPADPELATARSEQRALPPPTRTALVGSPARRRATRRTAPEPSLFDAHTLLTTPPLPPPHPGRRPERTMHDRLLCTMARATTAAPEAVPHLTPPRLPHARR